MDNFWIFTALYLNHILLVITFLAIFLKFRKNFKDLVQQGLLLGVAVFIRTFVVYSIRFFFPTKRPFENPGVTSLIEHSAGSSFPSGHASFAFVLAAFVFSINKKLGVFCFVLATLVAISRVYVKVHYPQDVIVGAIIGVASFFMAKKIVLRVVREIKFFSSKSEV